MKIKLTNTNKTTSIRKVDISKNIKRQIINFAFLMLYSIIIFFIITTASVKGTVVKPTSQFYVNDYANILSNETEKYIINTNVELQQKTGAQIVVVTVKSLDGMDIEGYANKLFNEFEIGDKEKNNGVLLLCSYGDREFRVEVGYGLEGKLPDGKTGRMQDEYIIPYLKEDKFDEGIKNGYSAFLKEVSEEYGVKITEIEDVTKEDTFSSYLSEVIIKIIMLIIFTIIMIRFRGRGGPFIFFGGGFHGGGSSGFSGGGFSGGGGHSGGGGSSRSF